MGSNKIEMEFKFEDTLSIYFSDNILLLLPTSLHKYMYFLVLIFSKQAHLFRCDAFVGMFYVTSLCAFKHQTDPNLNVENSNT